MMPRSVTLALLALIGFPPLPARTLPEATSLEDGRSIERRLTGGDDHRYFVAAAAGECIHLIVEQHDGDLIVQTRDRAGNPIADFNDEVRRDGEERVELVADAAGIYSVTIRASSVAIASGR